MVTIRKKLTSETCSSNVQTQIVDLSGGEFIYVMGKHIVVIGQKTTLITLRNSLPKDISLAQTIKKEFTLLANKREKTLIKLNGHLKSKNLRKNKVIYLNHMDVEDKCNGIISQGYRISINSSEKSIKSATTKK